VFADDQNGIARQARRLSVLRRRPMTDLRSARTLLGLVGPGSGLAGQGMRYVLAGGTVALMYLISTTLLAEVVGLPFQVALPIGFALALCVHFTLQRLFVWVDNGEFALPFQHQARRYLVVAGVQYGVTAATTSLLPAAMGLPTEVVYLITVLLLGSANFVVFRNIVFHPERTEDRLRA
jgi:putative flippase GtrA